MAHKLKHIVLDRVDLVPEGANPNAHVVLMKSKEAHVDKDTAEKVEKERIEKEKAEKAAAEKSAAEKVEKERLEKETADKVEKERIEKEKAEKALDAQAAEVKKANDRADKLEKEVEIEKTKRETIEFVAKARTDLPNLTGTAEEKGAILQSVYKHLPKDEADKVATLLKTGDAAVHTLMKETGGAGDDSGDGTAISDLKKKGEEIRKAEPKLSEHQAFRKACNDNPSLYKQYQQERRTRTA